MTMLQMYFSTRAQETANAVAFPTAKSEKGNGALAKLIVARERILRGSSAAFQRPAHVAAYSAASLWRTKEAKRLKFYLLIRSETGVIERNEIFAQSFAASSVDRAESNTFKRRALRQAAPSWKDSMSRSPLAATLIGALIIAPARKPVPASGRGGGLDQRAGSEKPAPVFQDL